MRRSGMVRLLVSVSILLAVAAASTCLAASAAQKEPKEQPKFRWAFGAIRGGATAPGVEPLAGTAALTSGDKVKAMIELRRKCYVYLIHHNSQGEMTLLFPYNLKQFADLQPGRRYYIPKGGDAWFQLDNKTGRETFYLIASDQRLLDVEYLYEKYVSADPEKRPELAGQMLAELATLKNQYQASAGQAEILAQNDAPVRGFERATGADPTDIALLASDISFNSMYSDTIIIEHR